MVNTVDMLGLLSEFGVICPIETCGSPVSYQGYDYATTLIDGQCWFAENLRCENYLNGDAIPGGLADGDWQYTFSGATAVYGENVDCNHYAPDLNACDPMASLEAYGRLYNWYAVDDSRGICPTGWHVPTASEWVVLSDELGGDALAGVEMKAESGWSGGGVGTNSSGFFGLPGGYRSNVSGSFDYAGRNGSWWSSTSNSMLLAGDRTLYYANDDFFVNSFNKNVGFSVRCLRDAE